MIVIGKRLHNEEDKEKICSRGVDDIVAVRFTIGSMLDCDTAWANIKWRCHYHSLDLMIYDDCDLSILFWNWMNTRQLNYDICHVYIPW